MAGYPTDYDLDVVLRDGGVVRVRPIVPDDADRLRRFFEQLGPQSRYFRFFQIKKELEPGEISYFTQVDYDRRMALIALHGEDMIGVGRYDRLTAEPEVAEVAFAVADRHQGRGIGTELLQLLTVYARQQGVASFQAFVLPENVQMMRVFRNSGYELTRTLSEGVYTVSFPVAMTEHARSAEEERERRAGAASILPLFFPRSVAVVGASTTPGSIGYRLFANLLKQGFAGPIYPVNPNAAVVQSVRAYPSVADVPDEVDLAFIVVPAKAVIATIAQCAAKGVRGVVVISAGFSEVGPEGRELERELVDLVRAAGLRMVGPNCMGLISTSAALNGTFAPVYPPAGNVAMSSQSGALGIAILDYARRANIGISQFVSVGNKADVSGNDLLLAWEDDPQTDVIVLYLESFGNPRRFHRLARRIARKKPIVAVKSGRTGAGKRAASSHTGALASLDVAVDALFEQSGVIRTDTLEELFAVASLLANQPVPEGNRVGIVTNAGGPGILAADALESGGLVLPELSPGLRARLGEVLSVEASTRNPIDLIASAGPPQYRHCLEMLLASGEVDSVMVIYVPTTPEGVDEVAAAVRGVADGYEGRVPMLAVFMQAEDAARKLVSVRRAVPTYQFPEMAAQALRKSVAYGRWRQRPLGTIPDLGYELETPRRIVTDALGRLGEQGGWLEPAEVEAVLSSFAIALPKSETVKSAHQAVEAAQRIGYPVVAKVISSEALHKSEVGGVALDLDDAEAVANAFTTVTSRVESFEGVLIQQMIRGGHEALVGMTEDPAFGPLIGFGLGGIFVELLGDVSFRIAPLTDFDAADLVSGIKSARLLSGYRNLPPGDVEAVEQTLLAVSALVGAIPEVVEMDLNPVKVLEPGQGIRVVDARIRVRQAEGGAPGLVDLPSVKARHV